MSREAASQDLRKAIDQLESATIFLEDDASYDPQRAHDLALRGFAKLDSAVRKIGVLSTAAIAAGAR